MASRILRDGLADSEVIAALHDRTFRLWIHLLLAADDYGLVAVDFGPIKRASPMAEWPRELVAKMLCELTDAELIIPYEVGGKHYAAIARWKAKINSIAPKHPVPSFGMQHVLEPYGYKSHTVRDAALKILKHINNDAQKSASLGIHQIGTSAALVPEGVRGKGLKEAPEAPDPIWTEGLQVITAAGIGEPNARRFIGMLCADWEKTDVLDALRAAVGKVDPKAYAQSVLNSRPRKGFHAERKVAL